MPRLPVEKSPSILRIFYFYALSKIQKLKGRGSRLLAFAFKSSFPN
jgi:hypothetical protein